MVRPLFPGGRVGGAYKDFLEVDLQVRLSKVNENGYALRGIRFELEDGKPVARIDNAVLPD